MDYRDSDAIRRRRTTKCYSDCERSPAEPRISRSDPHWMRAYDQCRTSCNVTGQYRPYRHVPHPKTNKLDCVRQYQLELSGEDVTSLPGYNMSCKGRFAGSKGPKRMTPWIKGVMSYWEKKKRSNPGYKYSQALSDYSKIYHKR